MTVDDYTKELVRKKFQIFIKLLDMYEIKEESIYRIIDSKAPQSTFLDMASHQLSSRASSILGNLVYYSCSLISYGSVLSTSAVLISSSLFIGSPSSFRDIFVFLVALSLLVCSLLVFTYWFPPTSLRITRCLLYSP